MIDNFKFFEGKVYTDEFEFPRVRRSPEHIGRGYIQTILPTEPYLATQSERNYDAKVIQIVRTRMNNNNQEMKVDNDTKRSNEGKLHYGILTDTNIFNIHLFISLI